MDRMTVICHLIRLEHNRDSPSPEPPNPRKKKKDTEDLFILIRSLPRFLLSHIIIKPKLKRTNRVIHSFIHSFLKHTEFQNIMSDELCDVGLWGLAVMGQNFALNMASEGFRVVVGNRSISKVEVTVQRAKKEGNLPLIGASDQKDFIGKLSKPRKVIILVMAGKPVDETIASLAKYMEPGDVIVDGGNEWYPNSIRRAAELESKGILFMGMGISGGEEVRE